MIIAINGVPGTGKDTIGSMIQYLTSECSNVNGNHYRTYQEFLEKRQDNNDYQSWYNSDWEIKKFAGKLKQVATLLTGIPTYKFEDQEFKKTKLGPEWDMTIREFLQKLGTDAIRDHFHVNTWVNSLFSDYTEDSNWVITDLRFPNEFDRVKAFNGITVQVIRPGITGSNHESDTALNNFIFDYIIINDGSVEELFERVKALYDDITRNG